MKAVIAVSYSQLVRRQRPPEDIETGGTDDMILSVVIDEDGLR